MKPETDLSIVLTCEHASFNLPLTFQSVFPENKLLSHQGWDKGAWECCSNLAQKLKIKAEKGRFSRLFVDLNRSENHKKLIHPAISNKISDKEKFLTQYYWPFRNKVYENVQACIARGFKVLHISVHSFTPVLQGVKRNSDFGILYDPGRLSEKTYAFRLRQILETANSKYIVRMNYPYRGTSDGHVTYLRKHFNNVHYMGIELELNQKYWKQEWNEPYLNWVLQSVFRSISELNFD